MSDAASIPQLPAQASRLAWLQVAKRGVPLAEVNLDTSGATGICDYIFQAGLSLPAD